MRKLTLEKIVTVITYFIDTHITIVSVPWLVFIMKLNVSTC